MRIASIAHREKSMLRHIAWVTAAAIVAISGVVVRPAPVFAQDDSYQKGPLEYISPGGDPRVIRSQMEIAIKAAEMAVDTLERGDIDRAQAHALKAYILLRYAQWGVVALEHAAEGRSVSEKSRAHMALTTVNEARERCHAGRMAIQNAEVEEAIQSLTDSILIAQRAAILLPR